jgi:hypothetical protein
MSQVGYELVIDGPEGKDITYLSLIESNLEKIRAMKPFRMRIMDTDTNVYCEIYMVTNHVDGKKYIGQAVTHRLNNARYRPFGAEKRFKSHVSQAKCNSACKPCQEFHLAIRKDIDSMEVEVLACVPKEEATVWETHFIAVHDTLYPNGYNLTPGGAGAGAAGIQRMRRENPTEIVPVEHEKRETGTTIHTAATKAKIATGVHAFHDESERSAKVRESIVASTREKHMIKKYEVGMAFSIDASKLESYIDNYKTTGIVVIFERKRGGKRVTFSIGTDETLDECRGRAMAFLQELVRRQASNQTNQT